jgi:D-glycero-D-manno-heptose 1,7-bisphosphate phosphatase
MSDRPTARAIFLDRDGTLVHARHYPSRPEELILYDELGGELRACQAAGFRLVVITNQSGLARGLFTADDLRLMHEHLARELARFDVRLDGVYHCPHHPTASCRASPSAAIAGSPSLGCCCGRHPIWGSISGNPGSSATSSTTARRVTAPGAARSWSISARSRRPASPIRTPTFVARDTCHALQLIRGIEGAGAAADLHYRPRGWELAVGN